MPYRAQIGGTAFDEDPVHIMLLVVVVVVAPVPIRPLRVITAVCPIKTCLGDKLSTYLTGY